MLLKTSFGGNVLVDLFEVGISGHETEGAPSPVGSGMMSAFG